MKIHTIQDIHENRAMNKMGLETYFLNKENKFDSAVDELIESIKTENVTLQTDHDGWVELEETDKTRYEELEEIADRHEISLMSQRHDYILNIIYNEERLSTLSEMKIIYAFKFLEINIKKLLRASYTLENTNEFYKWDYIERFLNGKGINAKTLNGYTEVIQLKTVNNVLKHTDEFENKLKSIKEFKNCNELTFAELEKFYYRIEPFPNIFLQSLIYEIYKELYEFNDDKIKRLATEYVLRMDKTEAIKFTNKIKEYYK